MARRKSNRTTQRAGNIARRGSLVSAQKYRREPGLVHTTTGRRRNVSGRVTTPLGKTLETSTGKKIRGNVRTATRGEATRFRQAETVRSRSGMRKLGAAQTNRQRDLTARRKAGLQSRAKGVAVSSGSTNRRQRRREVFVSSGGRSKSGARSVFNRLHPRAKNGRFRRK